MDFIYDSNTYEKYSIYSDYGKRLLKQYIHLYNQRGGLIDFGGGKIKQLANEIFNDGKGPSPSETNEYIKRINKLIEDRELGSPLFGANIDTLKIILNDLIIHEKVIKMGDIIFSMNIRPIYDPSSTKPLGENPKFVELLERAIESCAGKNNSNYKNMMKYFKNTVEIYRTKSYHLMLKRRDDYERQRLAAEQDVDGDRVNEHSLLSGRDNTDTSMDSDTN